MTSQQRRYRNFSSGSAGRERVPSDDGFYQGMLKATDGRKGTCMGAVNGKQLNCTLFPYVCDSTGRECSGLLERCEGRMLLSYAVGKMFLVFFFTLACQNRVVSVSSVFIFDITVCSSATGALSV